MKYLPCKDHLLYLALAGLLSLGGACFTVSVLNELEIVTKFFYLPIFFINALLVYNIVHGYYENAIISLCTSLLYLFLPTHLDIFLYPFQFQSILAETSTLLAVVFYKRERMLSSLLMIVFSQILNAKLIVLGLLPWLSKKFTNLHKIYSTLVSLLIFTFVFPLFFQGNTSITQFKVLINIVGNYLIPTSFSLIDLSIVDQSFFNIQMLMSLLFFGVVSLAFLKKKHSTFLFNIISIGLVVSILGAFIPFKTSEFEDFNFYYLPSFYPGVWLVLIMVFANGLTYLKNQKSMLLLTAIISIYWQVGNFVNQRNFQDLIGEWDYSYELLPQDPIYERNIKLKYIGLLIENKQYEKAKIVTNEVKVKYLEAIWYNLLLEIAFKTNNQNEAESIFKELNLRRVPFDSIKYDDSL